MSLNETNTFPLRTLVIYGIGLLGALIIIGFVLFQARFMIIGPKIVLEELPPGPYNSRSVVLSGTAYNISRLWLNDRPVYTDVTGRFSETVVLENGSTIATLRAEDRYGRLTKVSTPLVFVPASLYEHTVY